MLPVTTYTFDDFTVIPAQYSLYRGSEIIKLERKVFDTLLLLIDRNGQVATKEEFTTRIWPDVIVTERSLTRNVAELRKALDDFPPYRYIETVPGRGYRFCVPIVTHSASGANEYSTSVLAEPSTQSLIVKKRAPLFLFLCMLIIGSACTALIFTFQHNSKREKFITRQLTHNATQLPILAAAISPNGRIIAYCDQAHLYVSDEKIAESHELQLPDGLISDYMEWYPDNIHLLVSGYNTVTHEAEVWRLSDLKNEAKQLIANATSATISVEGNHIAYIRNSTELWMADPDGFESRKIAVLSDSSKFYTHPQFTFDGKYIIDGRSTRGDNHSVIEARDIASGAVTHLLDSDTAVFGYAVLPDNELLIARQLDSSKANTKTTIYKFNPTNGYLSALHEITSLPDHLSLKFTASRDGRHILCIDSFSQSDVYVADLLSDGTVMKNTRRLTLDDSLDRPSGWLADNHTVLFHSDRSGKEAVYKQNIDSSIAELVVAGQRENYRGVVTHDQKWLFYFEINSPTYSLIRQSMDGGLVTIMDTRTDMYWLFRCASRADRCILADYTDKDIRFVQFDPVLGRGKELAQVDWIPTYTSYIWDVSPDGTQLAYIDLPAGPDIIRVLNLVNQSVEVTTVRVADRDRLRTLFWDANGNGFYVSAYDTNGQVLQLLHVSLDGSSQTLRTQANSGEGWAIPSPDGKHLAYQQWTDQSNIWILNRTN